MLERVREQEYVRVSALAEMFGISEVTVRSDLDALQKQGRVRRVRGGAVVRPAGPQLERSLEWSLDTFAAEKQRIGRAAAAYLSNGENVLLDVGSTAVAVAEALVARTDLSEVTVFTNGLQTALSLEPAIPGITVVLTGGTLRPLQHSLVNPLATPMLEEIHADTVILGCNGVHLTAGVTNLNLPEAETKRAMAKAANRRVVVATGEKIGEVSLAPLCSIDELDLLITDSSADPDVVDDLREVGLEVEVVE